MDSYNQRDSHNLLGFAPAEPAPLPPLVAMLRPLVNRSFRCRNIGVWQVRLRCHGLHSLTQLEASLEPPGQGPFVLQRLHSSMVHYLTRSCNFNLIPGEESRCVLGVEWVEGY